MSCSFLSLPTEILIRILLHVPARHLLTCTQLNRYISNIIKDAAILQYTIEAYFAGAQVLDGSDYDKLTESSLADRLDRLKKREAAWRSFRPDFRERIEVPHVASGIYDLSGGIYLLGESGDSRSTTTALRYLTLPEHMFDEAKWQRINLQKQIVDIGLSIYEHDLMAVVTSTPDRADFSYVSIELTLLQLSTSNHHPLAKQPIISCVQTTLGGTRLAVSIEIVGRYLALVITFHAPFFAQSNDPKDRFLVFDWKEGKQLLDHTAPAGGVYTSLVFLSPTVVMIANTHETASLDIWTLSSSPSFLGSLLFPPLRQHFMYRGVSARSEPNPYVSHSPETKFQPNVYYDPNESIVVVNVHILLTNGMPWRTALVVSHRKALLAAAEQLRDCLPSSADDPDSEPLPPKLDFQIWGTKITRWLPAGNFSTRWITTSVGQRLIMSNDFTHSTELGEQPIPSLLIYDFNPHHIRKWTKEQDNRTNTEKKAFWSGSDRITPRRPASFTTWRESLVDDDDDDDGHDLLPIPEDGDEADDDQDDDSNPVITVTEDLVDRLGLLEVVENDDGLETFTFGAGTQPLFTLPPTSPTLRLDSEASSSMGTSPTPGPSSRPLPAREAPPLAAVTTPSSIFGSLASSTPSTFTEDVASELPFVVYAAPRELMTADDGLNGRYEGVLMDEERIIGLKIDENELINVIDVFHFG